jgi:hypothetical protein
MSGTGSWAVIDAQKLEIERLRGWLAYIQGRFAPADECAAAALRGDPVPEDD